MEQINILFPFTNTYFPTLFQDREKESMCVCVCKKEKREIFKHTSTP